jgi:outer membrane usher protein FimD/PapC
MIILSLAASGAAWETGFDIVPVDDIDTVDAAPVRLPPPQIGADNDGNIGSAEQIGAGDDGNIGSADAAPRPVPAAAPVRRPATREELGQLSSEELFMLAFGRAAPERPRNIMLLVFVEGHRLEPAEVVYTADFSSFNFISPALSEALDILVLPELRAAAGDSTGFFNSAVMEAAGYTVAADESAYELRVTIRSEDKTLHRKNLQGGYVWIPRGERVKPAYFSFYVNYFLSESFTYSHLNYAVLDEKFSVGSYHRSPLNATFNGVFMTLGWVLEGGAWLREPSAGQPFDWENYHRGNIILSRDIISRSAKFSAGDIGLDFGGGSVGGVRYEYNQRFFGGSPRDEESSVTFFMPSPGHVEVYMDGIYQQRFFLPAGHHEISGFGGDPGRNRVRLVLRMDDGSVDEVPFEYILSNARNISRGEVRYSAAAGFRREQVPSPACYEYVIDDPAASFDLQYGLSNSASAGLTGASSRYNSVASLYIAWNLGKFGWLDIRGAANYTPGADEPFGERVDVSLLPNTRLAISRLNRRMGGGPDGGLLPPISLSLRGYYLGESYNGDPFRGREEPAQNSTMGGFSGNLGFGFFRGGVSGMGGMNFFRMTERNAAAYVPFGYNYGVRVSQTFMRIPISFSAGVSVVGEERWPYFTLGMNHGFGVGATLGSGYKGHQLSASANIGTGMGYSPLVLRPIEYPDSVLADPNFDGPEYEIVPDDGVRLSVSGGADFGWSWQNAKTGVGAQSYSANVGVPDIFDPKIPGLRANFGHTYNRAVLSGGYNLANNSSAFSSGQTHALNAVFAGSFMFADGLWAFGRPTYGSFALIDAKHDLKGASVYTGMQGFNQGYHSRSGRLGAAYENRIGTYSPTTMMLVLADIPSGAMPDNNRFFTEGGRQQGYALRLGGRSGVLALTRITSRGAPVIHTYASIERADGREDPSLRATFTGSDGTLQISNLTPGVSYRIKFSQASGLRDIIIEIPRGSDLILELGEIEVQRDLYGRCAQRPFCWGGGGSRFPAKSSWRPMYSIL